MFVTVPLFGGSLPRDLSLPRLSELGLAVRVSLETLRYCSRQRGMTVDHQQRAIACWLSYQAISAPDPDTLIGTEHHQPAAATDPIEEPVGRAKYDTCLNGEEGL